MICGNTFYHLAVQHRKKRRVLWKCCLQCCTPHIFAGNHELEPQGQGNYFQSNKWGLDDGAQFNSYLARLPVTPLYENSDGAPLYFSTNVGPVHMVCHRS